MKRILVVAVTILLLISGCSSKNYRDAGQIKRAGVLNVWVYTGGGLPFAYDDNGQPKGVEVDFCYALADALSVTPLFKTATKAEVYEAVEAGEADIGIGTFSRSSLGSQTLLYTETLAVFEICAVSRAGDVFGTLGALSGKTAAVVEGSAAEFGLINAAPENVQTAMYISADGAAGAVAAGEADVYICSEAEAAEAVKNNTLLIAGYIANAEKTEFSALVAKGNEALLKEANKVIEESGNMSE